MAHSLDQVVDDVAKPEGFLTFRKNYDLGRTPSRMDMLSLRLRLQRKFHGHEVTVEKDVTDMVVVTVGPNSRGWSTNMAKSTRSPTDPDDRLLTRRR